jgi:hypothetical protein
MTKMIATTQTGTTYTFDTEGGGVLIENSESPSTAWQNGTEIRKTWASKIAKESDTLMAPWAYTSGENSPWEDSDQPKVGYRWYVADRDQWRISTPIVSIEEG